MTRIRVVGALVSAALAAGLAGCSAAGPGPASPVDLDEPGSRAPAPDPCGREELLGGAEVAGPELADCVSAAVLEAGSGRVTQQYRGWDALFDGEGAFSTRDGQRLRIDFYDGRGGLVIIDDEAWYDDTMGWVKADPTGGPREMIAEMAAETVRAVASPEANRDVMAMFDTWLVAGPETVELPDGERVEGIRVDAVGERDLGDGNRLSSVSFVLDERMRPVTASAASSLLDVTVVVDQTFSDWGADIAIEPPV
ncbi:hypothetical protein [Homoserinibacter sp. YIM 151385]|uniref:hypothetical protein n=1 Tax=Homoserinibacter sp. YIM 151385 TaxID=2985506 RepID=UPI0022F02613|nr:hypothetical protein [Homoserinibacter sp. YIM 151385]WBU39102.1 hypothetical protein OF852_05870 [Homoserinibacter sp. YIM 151385]